MYHQYSYTVNKLDSEVKIIHETLKEQTLAIFIKGLINPITTIIKARNLKTLDLAKQLAKAEEAEYNSRYTHDITKLIYSCKI